MKTLNPTELLEICGGEDSIIPLTTPQPPPQIDTFFFELLWQQLANQQAQQEQQAWIDFMRSQAA